MTHDSRLRTAAAAALALLAAACATPEKPAPVAPPPVVQSAGKKVVTVSAGQSGAQVTLDKAQELVVRLPLGVAAGVEWSLVDLKPGVLNVQGGKFERELRSSNDEESSGAMVWHFMPAASGTVTLNFDLRRPRRLDPAVRTVSYTVTVP